MENVSTKINPRYVWSVLILVIIAMIIFACNKEETVKTPADHIRESESLVIPLSVAVPAYVPDGNTRVATYYAKGFQRYVSKEKPGVTPAEYEWKFFAPAAELYDITNAKVGTHGAGPFWTISPADSIFGKAYTPAKIATSPDNSIDWLLLTLAKTPTGIYKDVEYIQRIATTGGKAPTTAPTQAGDTINVSYTAIYRFTKKN